MDATTLNTQRSSGSRQTTTVRLATIGSWRCRRSGQRMTQTLRGAALPLWEQATDFVARLPQASFAAAAPPDVGWRQRRHPAVQRHLIVPPGGGAWRMAYRGGWLFAMALARLPGGGGGSCGTRRSLRRTVVLGASGRLEGAVFRGMGGWGPCVASMPWTRFT